MTTTTDRPTFDDIVSAFRAAGGWVETQPNHLGSGRGTVPVLDDTGLLAAEITCERHWLTGRPHIYAWAGPTKPVIIPCPPATAAQPGKTLAEAWLDQARFTAVTLAADQIQQDIAQSLDQYADPAALHWTTYGLTPLPRLSGYEIRSRPIWPGGAEGRDRPAVDIDACHPETGKPALPHPIWTSDSQDPLPRGQALIAAINKAVATA